MVLREQTVVQLKQVMTRMERPHDMRGVREILGDDVLPKPSRGVWHMENERTRVCMANNLFHSVFKCRIKKVRFLLDHGININTQSDYGYNVLIAALHIEKDDQRDKMFRFLLDNDADPMEKDPKYGRNTLLWACLLGRLKQVETLLETFMGDFNLHGKDQEGMTAMHLATQGGHIPIVRSLIPVFRRYGLTVDVTDSLGLTPYLHAKRLGYSALAEVLRIEGKASPSQSDQFAFKSPDEWSQVGSMERLDIARQRKMDKYQWAAITGNSRTIQRLDRPERVPKELPSIVLSAPSKDQQGAHSKADRLTSPGTSKSTPANIHLNVAESTGYRRFRVKRTDEDSDTNFRVPPVFEHVPRASYGFPVEATSHPKSFRRSQLDPAKAVEYQNVVADLNVLMKVLAHQQTPSFRQSVDVKKMLQIEAEEASKVSTRAIIFGKDKKGKQKSKHSSAKEGKKGVKDRSPGRKTKK